MEKEMKIVVAVTVIELVLITLVVLIQSNTVFIISEIFAFLVLATLNMIIVWYGERIHHFLKTNSEHR